jgi:hypothetical protein
MQRILLIQISFLSRAHLGLVRLQFGSPSIIIMPRSLLTQRDAISSAPESSASRMPPWIMPLMHSYNRDMAGVVLIRVVKGGNSFRTSRGSKGVKVAN